MLVLPRRPQAPFTDWKAFGSPRTKSPCSLGVNFTTAEFSSGYPRESHPHPPSFTLNEREEHDCRNDHVQSEESGDAIRKKIVHEHRHVQRVMLDDPGNELRIGQNEPKQTEHQVEMSRFHAC